MSFLCILRGKAIDVHAADAVAEIVAVAAVPEVPELADAQGNITQAHVPAVPAIVGVSGTAAIAEVSHPVATKVWTERHADKVARMVGGNPNIDFYEIQLDSGLQPTLSKVSEKAGARRAAPAREVVDIVNAAGDDIGSHIVEA